MKTLFTLLAVAAVALVSCKDDSKGLLDPNAKVYINGVSAPQSAPEVSGVSKSGQVRLTPLEVVKQAGALGFHLGAHQYDMGVSDRNRDLINVRIVGPSTWVVSMYGELSTDFLEGRHTILMSIRPDNTILDTIAYIPNAVLRTAEVTIKAAYAAKDYAACYRIFEEAYVFVPITGAEYKALQQQGLN